MWSMVKSVRLGEVRGLVGGLYGPDLHAKRVMRWQGPRWA